MANIFSNFLSYMAKKYKTDTSGMLIITGVAGWTLSSLAQICGVLFNPKLTKEQKGFLVPQELADAAVNIGSFFAITQVTKKVVHKLFTTGKFAPSSVRKFLSDNKDFFKDKVGKLNFNVLDEAKLLNKPFPEVEYHAAKDFGTTLATVCAGVVASNIVTPNIRNIMASGMQKKYIQKQQKTSIYPQNSSLKI